jgi:hypothetical protein
MSVGDALSGQNSPGDCWWSVIIIWRQGLKSLRTFKWRVYYFIWGRGWLWCFESQATKHVFYYLSNRLWHRIFSWNYELWHSCQDVTCFYGNRIWITVLLFFKFWTFSIVSLSFKTTTFRGMALPSSSGDLLWWVRSMELASIGGRHLEMNELPCLEKLYHLNFNVILTYTNRSL